MKSATKKLEAIVSDLAAIDGDGYPISEVEVSASFDVNGKFLGFGVGGDVSVKSPTAAGRVTPDRLCKQRFTEALRPVSWRGCGSGCGYLRAIGP